MGAACIDSSLASNAVANGLAPFAAKRPKKLWHSGQLFTLAFPLCADGSVQDCPSCRYNGSISHQTCAARPMASLHRHARR